MTKRSHILLVVPAILAASACRTAAPAPPEASPLPVQRIIVRPVPVALAAPSAEQVARSTGAATTATSAALHAAADRAVGWWKLPADLPFEQILDKKRSLSGSTSLGSVASGVLLNGVELPVEGEGHSIIERHRTYKTRWGTQELVDLIASAGAYVTRHEGGAPLRVGNMSKQRGGDIRWSRSHNSGRDADLAFYCVDATTGASVPSPGILHFEEDGAARGRDDLRFDVARNWRLVEGLLSQDSVNVQWLFISLGLKQLLLDHARTVGAPAKLIERAESVLHQPTDALPHGDHFHLRIGCPKDDRIEGCLDHGPRWEWGDWHDRDLLARSLALSRAFESGDEDARVGAMEFLDELQTQRAADVATVWGIWDASERVRNKAVAIASKGYSWSAVTLIELTKWVRSGAAADQAWQAYSIMRRSRDPLARDFALERLRTPEVDERERVHAAKSLAHHMEAELVPAILELLPTQAPPVRVELGEVLRRVANRTEAVDWGTSSETKVAEGVARWREWWSAHSEEPRQTWLADGFRAAGVTIDGEMSVEHVDALHALLTKGSPFQVYNANRSIRELTGRWAPLEQSDGRRLAEYWEQWWDKNRDRYIEKHRANSAGPTEGDDAS